MKNDNVITKQVSRYFFILLSLLYVPNIEAQNELEGKNEPDTVSTSNLQATYRNKIDTISTKSLYKADFKQYPHKVNIYDMPYSLTANYPNYKRLALNTGVLYGAGVVTLGVLELLPEDATSWNRKEIRQVNPFRRWVRNVKKGPVWDKDNFVFNYVLHPYGGAAYYMGARSQGFNLFYSFLYSAGISTLFWEYGIEAFMEVPSIQDLIITPITGTLIGEGFYLLKRHIVDNEYRLCGSRFLGCMTAYIVDPVNEVIGIFAGNPNKKNLSSSSSLSCTPWFNKNEYGANWGFMVNLSF
ncbi:DUF3943 domain-containing protein [Dysgonomonas sp. 520]|uniref:DUF3943 domain-containing protein n=1 Tax=Dysgonomonas sp. 520 TaxID=2302931 RepID=UPI0013D33655|nr:DUF3943 domain-containing protein [Dysgonomonas sp. 520]